MKKWLFSTSMLLSSTVYAAEGIPDLSRHLIGVESGIRDMFDTVAILTGAGLIMGGFVLFHKHRKTPTAVPLGSSIVMLLGGIALIALSFIPMPV